MARSYTRLAVGKSFHATTVTAQKFGQNPYGILPRILSDFCSSTVCVAFAWLFAEIVISSYLFWIPPNEVLSSITAAHHFVSYFVSLAVDEGRGPKIA